MSKYYNIDEFRIAMPDCEGCDYFYTLSEYRGRGSYEDFAECGLDYNAYHCVRMDRDKIIEDIIELLHEVISDERIENLISYMADNYFTTELIDAYKNMNVNITEELK